MLRILREFCADEQGATAIEYALIASGISLAIFAAVGGLGGTLQGRFALLNTTLK
ncbi:MAG: putative Flp/Fap pilin component [Tardiphaga sp.]|nr:putative Flp/Fap pilin component [Tardiphaga sp.]